MQRKEKRYDHHFHDLEQDGTKLQAHREQSVKEFRLAKACAYRMAKSWLAILQHDLDKLVDQLQGSGKNPDEWLDGWFAPLTAMGEDWRELVTAVQDGMTLKKYLSETPGTFLDRKRREKTANQATPEPALPSEPKPELPLKERAVVWETRAKASSTQLCDVRRKLRLAEQRIAVLELTIKKLHKIMEAASVET